ncbi:MAG: hypothetical protein N2202_07515 [Proteobacteria bacterium]|nr:hypothetical protein [Pseudomonadota bacterium]
MNNQSCGLLFKLKKRLLGELLIVGKFIEKSTLEKALERQKNNNKLLGELLIELGALSQEELKIVLKFQEDLSNPTEAIKFAGGLRKKFGELLLEVGRITENQLEEALSIQKLTGKKIGEILIEKGYINYEELKAILLFQKTQEHRDIPKKFKLGELLVNLNIITKEQLEHALDVQKLEPEKKLGEILIQLGYAKNEDIQKGLTLQQKLATIALSTLITFSSTFFVNEVSANELGSSQQSKGRVQITAEVKSFAKLNLIKQIPDLIITETHLSKGYVELNNATSLEIRTNTKAIFIVFEGFGDGIIEEVEINGFDEPVKIGPNGGMILIKNLPKSIQYNLSYRLKISQYTRIGTYAWPYSISVSTY